MAVLFKSIIKFSTEGKWFIELIDTTDNKVAICKNLDEYSKKVEEFGEEYGGAIDEVKWSKDDNVPPFILDEIRMEMAIHQEELEKQKAEKEQNK